MNSWPLISIAFILILKESCLQKYHSQGPYITFIQVTLGSIFFSLESLSLFRWDVKMRQRSFEKQALIVGVQGNAKRVIYLDISLGRKKDRGRREALMRYLLFLEVAKWGDNLSRYLPEFFLLELPLLEVSCVDLLLEWEIRPLPKTHQLEVSWAKLLLVLRYNVFKSQYTCSPLSLSLSLPTPHIDWARTPWAALFCDWARVSVTSYPSHH